MKLAMSYQKVLIALFFVCAFLFAGCDSHPIEQKQVKVVFRFDDYSARSSTAMELRIIDAFRNNEASFTIGVIPFICADDVHDPSPQDIVPLTTKKADILRTGYEDGILDIALHGYSHQTNNAENMMEFSSLDYNIQIERLAKGKRFLEHVIGAPVTTFIPPWNKYDLNTLRALEELGFSTLSADDGGEVTEHAKINFLLPNTCFLLQLRDAVKAARTSSSSQPLIVVLFHEYDFKEIDEKRGSIHYQEFSDLMNWLKFQKDVQLLSISQATTLINDLGAKRFLLNKRHRFLNSLLPSLLQDEETELLYHELAVRPTKVLLKVTGFCLAIVCIGIVLSFVMGMLVFPRSQFIMNIVVFGSIVLSVIILIYVLYGHDLSFRRMIVSAGVVGVLIGICLSFLYLRKKKIWDGKSIV